MRDFWLSHMTELSGDNYNSALTLYVLLAVMVSLMLIAREVSHFPDNPPSFQVCLGSIISCLLPSLSFSSVFILDEGENGFFRYHSNWKDNG